MTSGGEAEEPPVEVAKTVLVVDDEQHVRQFVRRALERCGYRVILAAYTREALRAWARHSLEIDLVVTDVRMPGRTGCSLAAALRHYRPDLPIVLISGCGQGQLYELGVPLLGCPILRKPFQVTCLRNAVRDAMAS